MMGEESQFGGTIASHREEETKIDLNATVRGELVEVLHPTTIRSQNLV